MQHFQTKLSVVQYAANWCTFKPNLEKIKKIRSEKISYISGNGTSRKIKKFSKISENGPF